MSNIKWTNSQQNAISSRGGTLLISAAAGSGKTAVLSQRAVDRMLDSVSPIDGNRMLISTYTNLAAKEMRQRIVQKLNDIIEQNPNDSVARTQRQLVSRAHIGTIHSFCFNLVKQNFQKLLISPNFRIGDDSQINEIKFQVVSQVLEQNYKKENNQDFIELVELVSGGKNDSRLEELIISVYDFIRSLPFYRNWIEKRLALYSQKSIPDSIWGKEVINYCLEAAKYAVSIVEKGLDVISEDDILQSSYKAAFDGDMIFLHEVIHKLSKNDWTGCQTLVMSFSHISLGRKKVEDKSLQERAKGYRDEVKKIVLKITDYITVCNEQEFIEDLKDLYPKVEKLFNIVLDFDDLLNERKKELTILDFGDLEHMALQLLVDDGTPTAIAKELSQQFDEIMVDECQDINSVQDMIFKALSKGDNLFFVGDVKQSIYSFRQAMPQLFIDKLDEFHKYDEIHFPAKILLSDNFRTRKEVTQPINFIFSLLMNRQLGGVDYTKDEYLHSSAIFPESEDCGIEIHLLDKNDMEDDVKSQLSEAEYVARLVKNMLKNGYLISEENGKRQVKASDICVLLRSPKKVAQYYQKAFYQQGIGVCVDVGEEFLTSMEVRAVVNLLKAINNPLLDIEMIGAMLSPIFGFTAEELAKIRLNDTKGCFYNAIRADKNIKSKNFVESLRFFRQISACGSVSELVNYIYEKTMFDTIVLSMEAGEQRHANLMLLTEYIFGFEKNGTSGLSGVLRIFDSMIEKDKDLIPATISNTSSSVTIMSIHKSKGLEFPVVILSDTGKGFNKQDIHSSFIMDNEMGFACVRREHDIKKQYPTLPLVACKIKNLSSLLSEELRVLYVALTRAKEKLIVTASLKDPSLVANKLYSQLDNGKLPLYMIKNSKNYIEWIISAVVHMDCLKYDVLSGVGYQSKDLKFIYAKPFEQEEQSESSELQDEFDIDEDLLEKLKSQVNFVYQYPNAIMTPTKLSVSEITNKSGASRLFSQTPKFITGHNITPSERGNAVHAFMQFCDYDLACQDAQKELTRLEKIGILSTRLSKAVDVRPINKFFKSDLWKKIKSADRILREYRFISHMKLDIGYSVAEDGEPTVLQGIADLIIVKNNKATLVDFKTDRIKSKDILVDRYRKQLELYREMISDNLKIEVDSAVLYSFYMNSEIKVF